MRFGYCPFLIRWYKIRFIFEHSYLKKQKVGNTLLRKVFFLSVNAVLHSVKSAFAVVENKNKIYLMRMYLLFLRC